MRVIIHIDVDCFYAQVEMVKNPQIANSPVGVLQNQTISTCNYVARQRGLKKMTHRTDALKMVPDLIVVQANMESYRLASAEIFEKYIRQMPFCCNCSFEQTGLDEGYLDVTREVEQRMESPDCKHLVDQYKNDLSLARLLIGSQIAQDIRIHVLEQFRYTTSAGIAHNKFLSKIASSMAERPNGQAILFPSAIQNVLGPLPLSKIPTIGRKTSALLAESLFIFQLKDVERVTMEQLRNVVGEKKAHLILQASKGIDSTQVIESGPVKSIGQELTFLPVDNLDCLGELLAPICNQLLDRIKRDQQKNKRIATLLTVRWALSDYWSKFSSASTKCQIDALRGQCSAVDILHLVINVLKENVKPPFKLTRVAISVSSFQAEIALTNKRRASTLDSFVVRKRPREARDTHE